ncbi:MAG: hypothetical protein IKH84_04330 [Ottowia sp.]|nr:hypothetical protein [Ottowia sp.]
MPDTNEETKPKRWPFIIQLPSLCVAPIALLRLSLPLTGEVKVLGALAYVLVFFFAFPAGLIALIYMKRHAGALGSLEKPTKVLAIINILMVVLVVVPLLILFLAVLISGVTA